MFILCFYYWFGNKWNCTKRETEKKVFSPQNQIYIMWADIPVVILIPLILENTFYVFYFCLFNINVFFIFLWHTNFYVRNGMTDPENLQENLMNEFYIALHTKTFYNENCLTAPKKHCFKIHKNLPHSFDTASISMIICWKFWIEILLSDSQIRTKNFLNCDQLDIHCQK